MITSKLSYMNTNGSMPLVKFGKGYSGAAIAVNNPDYETIHFRGPIYKGHYHVGPMFYHPEKGPYVLGLSPVGHGAPH